MDASLTKLDVARSQLVTAIRLLFRNEDLVSIFSLAANAWEIIDVLCRRDGIDSLSKQTRGHLSEKKDLKIHYINAPYRNFFKHADRDPDEVLPSLNESTVDAMIYLAVEDYLRLLKKAPLELQVFQIWYLSLNIDKLSAEAVQDVLNSTESFFPKIRNFPRNEQLAMGQAVLQFATQDESLLKDEKTEQN